MPTSPRNIHDSLATFDDLWSPRTLATINDTEVRLVKVRGDYVWHRHPDSDEMFVVVEGHLRIALREGEGEGEGEGEEDGAERSVDLHAHDVFVVPRGVEHRPSSTDGASALVLDRTGTLTTGDFAGQVPDHITSTTAGLALE